MSEGQAPKLHAACDICRKRKLKCTGEHPKCSRCERKGLDCIYAVQKTMGRPKKRPVEDASGVEDATPGSTEQSHGPTKRRHRTNDLQAEDGNWFQGRGFGSPLMPDLHISSWPSLDEAGSMCEHSSDRGKCSNASTNPTTADSSNTPLTAESDQNDRTPSLPHDSSHDVANDVMYTNVPTGCACLSAMYLELSALQSMTDFSFPSACHQLRKAISTACGVLNCEQCPKSFFTGFQNIQLLGLFMMCTAERYTKVLAAVDAEAQKALDANETRSFRMGDLQGSNSHLHTHDPEICLASVQIDLKPHQWRSLVKRVIKGEKA
ncbi:hypothetical protein K461DRAFT_312575 [Myriangium duriaei CBS 260.36]|uniref:Zn(2)-C6 fungal-type domain-containing protein n=1 Tax=Myriangium duriaei CBS 260.36 TaxID=1168546 RepID=A0A9P4MG29_9PEZI|nr:hypothetical protein K461DRAFT_312575 [Myriangium duriaei CBS 260.36]